MIDLPGLVLLNAEREWIGKGAFNLFGISRRARDAAVDPLYWTVRATARADVHERVMRNRYGGGCKASAYRFIDLR
jgi:hypothetical protein